MLSEKCGPNKSQGCLKKQKQKASHHSEMQWIVQIYRTISPGVSSQKREKIESEKEGQTLVVKPLHNWPFTEGSGCDWIGLGKLQE